MLKVHPLYIYIYILGDFASNGLDLDCNNIILLYLLTKIDITNNNDLIIYIYIYI